MVRLLVGPRRAIRDHHSPHAAPAAPAHWSVATYATAHPRACAVLPRRVCPARFARLCLRCRGGRATGSAWASASQNALPLGSVPPTMARLHSRDQTGAARGVPSAGRTHVRGALPAHARWSLVHPCDSTSACSPPGLLRSCHTTARRSTPSHAPQWVSPVY